jgi:tRNA (uracil-5-)-methyltransferase
MFLRGAAWIATTPSAKRLPHAWCTTHTKSSAVPFPTRTRRLHATPTSTTCPTGADAASAEEGVPLIKVPAKFVPYPFQYRQEVEMRIESLTNRGLGIGRIVVEAAPANPDDDDDQVASLAEPDDSLEDASSDEQAKKWVVMVPSVIPGELVRVRVFRNFKNYSEADLCTVLEASPDRVTPSCPLAAEQCGGCQLQHMSIDSQRSWKTEMVKDFLAQEGIAEMATVSPCLGTAQVLGYRSKLTPHYQQPKKSRRGVENEIKMIGAIGFQQKTSRALVDVEHCPIATPAVNEAYSAVRHQLRSEPPKSKKGATLLLRQANLEDDYVETNHKELMTTKVGDFSFSYRAGNFFQNNYHILPLMVEHVIEQATRGGKLTHLADCYCGSGLFALSAAAHFEKVTGIEINDKAIAEATANAEANEISNCDFLAASAENIFDVIPDFPRDQTAVVLDPPRKGCSDEFLKQLYQFAPQRIVYMSCDPTTQARDAAGILGHGYEITSVQPFDLFPQTRHIECLMILERKASTDE